jgi:hypothetical protein
VSTVRLFRLAPPDRTGVLMGLGLSQFVVGGTALLVASLLFAHHQLGAGVVPVAAGAVVVFGRWRRQPVLDWLAAAGRLARLHVGGRRWYRPLPLVHSESSGALGLPPALAGQRILAVDGARYGWPLQPHVAVVHDTSTARYAASVRVAGERFALLDLAGQAAAVERWGDVLGGWCRERSVICQIRWCESAAPGGLEQHRTWLHTNIATSPVADAVAAYGQLLDRAGPMTTPHEVVLTLVADGRRVSRPRGEDRHQATVDALLAEVAALQTRLEIAGLASSPPLSPGELGRAMHARFDPWAATAVERRSRSLGHGTAVCDPATAGPLATCVSWKRWETDSICHRSFLAVEWPRVDVPADWLGRVLLPGGSVRAVCGVFEPIAPSRSRRALRFAATKLEGDEQTRIERGFHVPAALRRQRQLVAEREAELERGFGEVAYSGLVVVSGRSPDELDGAAARLCDVAAAAGIDLRPLDGRHDLAVAATLPLARGVSSPSALREVLG